MSSAPKASEIFGEDPRPARVFEVLGENRYRLQVPVLGLALEVDRLRRDRHELIGELGVYCDWAGASTVEGTLSLADFNLSSARARQERARLLEQRSRSRGDVDWSLLVEELCQRVIVADRAGQPAVLLRDLPRPGPDETFAVEGLRLLRRHPSILFGDGGSAKSYIALYLAGQLATRGVRVGIFDWELDGDDHRDRLERLFGADMPDVLYARCERPLYADVDRLQRIARDSRLDYAIYDSVAFACDGPPEAAEVAGRYFRAVRQVGIGSLHIAHISKAEGADQKPFGSAFWHNGARATWFIKPGESDDVTLTIGLFNRKANLGRLWPALGYEITFDEEGDRTLFKRVDLAKVDDLAKSLPLWQRVRHAVRQGPLKVHELAEELDASAETIDRTVRRMKQVFTRIDGRDGVSRIALVSKEVV